MVDAAPFRALRYDPGIAGDPAFTSAPAYDDLERDAYAHHRTVSPYTVLELLAEDADADYRRAAAAFARWRRTGVVVQDARPAFYAYEIHELRRGRPAVLRGVLAAVAVGRGDLLAHERVDPRRVAVRTRRMDAVPVELAPVFAVHSSSPPLLREVLDRPPQRTPLVALTDEAGADHRVWRVDDAAAVAAIREGLADVRAVIADGHHRHAVAEQLRDRRPGADRVLTYLVDASVHGPELLAVHRLVRGPAPDLRARLATAFALHELPPGGLAQAVEAAAGTVFGLLDGRGAALLVPRDLAALRARLPDGSEAWRSLDTALWDGTVRPLAGGEVEYRSDVSLATGEVTADPATALFVLRAPSMALVEACAAAGEVMPVKTTWFRPKPRAGLVMRSLD